MRMVISLQPAIVAPLAGSVDRNWLNAFVSSWATWVAPLAGSVDRNEQGAEEVHPVPVAPLAGSVDRNKMRRARLVEVFVAPLAGSVDRNTYEGKTYERLTCRSPRGERG